MAEFASQIDILDRMPQGILILSGDMNVVLWNNWLENQTGIKKADIIGKPVTTFFPDLGKPKFRERIIGTINTGIPTLLSSLIHRYFIPIADQSGGFRLQNAYVTPIPCALVGPGKSCCTLPEAKCAVVALTDVTEIETRNKAYKQMRELAIKEVEERRNAEEKLRAEKERVLETTELKDKFVSLVAHDLKSPVSSVLGLLDIVKDELTHQDGKIPDPILKPLTLAREACTTMLTTIGDLLQIGRIQKASFAAQKRFADANQVISHAINTYKFTAEKKGVTINNDVQPGTRIFVDPATFLEAIKNILSNAIKFSKHGASVTFSTHPDTPGAAETVLSIKDTGIGIDPAIQQDIFRHEVKTTTPGTMGERGTGFGLPLTADIISAHHGTISINSVPMQGSQFTIRLPKVKPKILVVEDDQNSAKLVAAHLAKLEVNLVYATNGLDGERLIASEKPDLVILDMYLPDKTGFEILEDIRKFESTASIPVIAITGDKNIETSNRAFRAGANDFIAKPFDRSDLLPRIRKYIV